MALIKGEDGIIYEITATQEVSRDQLVDAVSGAQAVLDEAQADLNMFDELSATGDPLPADQDPETPADQPPAPAEPAQPETPPTEPAPVTPPAADAPVDPPASPEAPAAAPITIS